MSIEIKLNDYDARILFEILIDEYTALSKEYKETGSQETHTYWYKIARMLWVVARQLNEENMCNAIHAQFQNEFTTDLYLEKIGVDPSSSSPEVKEGPHESHSSS